jgi:hypothetical protein
MNTKVKKGIFWGGIVASIILVINLFHYLFGGLHALAAGPHGHGPRGLDPRGGFGHPQMMCGHHSGFSWIWLLVFLILGVTLFVLAAKWLRRNAKAAAMQQFIDTSLMSSHKPLSNQSANVLDQWEQNVVTKKEND